MISARGIPDAMTANNSTNRKTVRGSPKLTNEVAIGENNATKAKLSQLLAYRSLQRFPHRKNNRPPQASYLDAQFGHTHDFHDHDEPDSDQPGDTNNIGNLGLMHVHDLGMQLLTLVPSLNVAPVQLVRGHSGVPPPATRPPDNLITPLYRPPIA